MSSVPSRSGLAEMVAAARHDGASHLVLADWLEEHLNRADVAAVLRASTTDPRIGKQLEQTSYADFRFAPLDAEVTLGMGRWQTGTQQIRQGYLIVLCVPLEAEVGLRRWVRWLEDRGDPSAEIQALWEKLGAGNAQDNESVP